MEEGTTTKRSKKTNNKNMKRYIVLGVVAVLVIAGGYFGWMQYQSMNQTPEAVAAQQEERKQKLLAEAGKIMVLPQEDSTMLEVNNAEQLKQQQAFFRDVQDGDVLFIFPQSLKAVIYRPSTKVIVNSGPLQTEPAPEGQSQQTQQPQTQPPTAETEN